MRNRNVDALRLIAAIGVISLHVGDYPGLPTLASDLLRASFRWCVPVFFMITGYFAADPASIFPSIKIRQVTKAWFIFFVASLVYLPIFIIEWGVKGVNVGLFIHGTYFHLWYLSALVIALISIHGLKAINRPIWTALACVVYVLAYVAINYYVTITGQQERILVFLRELIGIPCILLGAILARMRSGPFGLIFLVGVMLTFVEVLTLRQFGHTGLASQFWFGTLPVAFGLLGMAATARNIAPNVIASLGSRDGLGIYIYHPLVIVAITSADTAVLTLVATDVPGLALWAGSAIITVAALELLRFFPRLRSLADGDPAAFRRQTA